MQYQLVKKLNTEEINETIIKRIDDNGQVSYIPADMANRDWAAYQAWLAEENEPEAAE